VFVDARTLPDGSLVEADVCIVGAGAAGITIARELRSRPFRIALLESGWLVPDPDTQSLYGGEVRNQAYFALDSTRTRARYFGGTTNEWQGECRPLSALDFEQRDWVPDSGWPFSITQLLPYYERAHSVCQLGRFAYTAADWRAAGAQPIAFVAGRIQSNVFHYSPPTNFGEVYGGEIERARNIVTYLGANVVELETSRSPTHVDGVRVACLAGNDFRVKARVFILAAGGIENARLLLLSNRTQPAGLGNAYDLVGRYFMEHLYVDRAASVLAPEARISEFYTIGQRTEAGRVRGILALDPEVQRLERLTHFCTLIEADDAEPPAALGPAVLRALQRRRVSPRSIGHLRRPAARILRRVATRLWATDPPPRRYFFKTAMEQAPNRESRVMLGEERDRLGCARVALCWSLTSLDRRTFDRGHEILHEELRRANVGSLETAFGPADDAWPPGLRGARHHMGTTRMHVDPRRGVVDPQCRVHGISNLYVAGSSVFPTGGAANPTLTIVALALRLAEHVDGALRAGREA
jgi:choline dehydrogenase-like flavoprotein